MTPTSLPHPLPLPILILCWCKLALHTYLVALTQRHDRTKTARLIRYLRLDVTPSWRSSKKAGWSS